MPVSHRIGALVCLACAFLTTVAAVRLTGVASLPILPHIVFVHAKERNATTGWFEDAASACARFNLEVYSGRVPLSANSTSPVQWDETIVTAIIASLGYGTSSPLVPSCCASSLWCHRIGAGESDFRCVTHGLGGYTYENYGWSLDDSAVPVYACRSSSVIDTLDVQMDDDGLVLGLNVTDVIQSEPMLGPMTVIPARPSQQARLRIDGNNFGDTAVGLNISVNGVPCANPQICSDICSSCDDSGDCRDGKQCYGYNAPSGRINICLHPCYGDDTCPCGMSCRAAGVNPFTGATHYVCVNPSALTNSDTLCDQPGFFKPLQASGSDSRVECELAAPSTPSGSGIRTRGGVAGSRRYGTLHAASNAVVTVTRNGLSSAGLDARLLALAGVARTPSSDALNLTLSSCSSVADCPHVDAITTPVCAIPVGSSTPQCTYKLTSLAVSTAPSELVATTQVTPSSYLVLPREISSVLPFPAPPVGFGEGDPADMTNRQPSSNVYAIMWDPRNVWVSAGIATGGYSLSLAAYVDDTPPALFPLPRNITSMFGARSSYAYISPNGFIRFIDNAPCGAAFERSTRCTLANQYVGVVAPAVADFDPGHYDLSEIWANRFNYTSGNTELDSANRGMCAVWLNMGLWNPSASMSAPPSRSYTFQACLFEDGSVRFRYGAVLGVAGYAPGQWTSGTSVPAGGGMNVNAWFAGIRRLDAARGAPQNTMQGMYGTFLSSTSDVPISDGLALLLSQQAVRPGSSAGFCPYSSFACVTNSCGSVGASVSIQWTPPRCGLGFDSFLQPTSPSQPHIECLFGSVPSIATYDSSTKSISCTVPAQPEVMGANATVQITIVAVIPLNARHFSGIPNSFVAFQWPTLQERQTLGIGSPAPVVNQTGGFVIVPLNVFGLEEQRVHGNVSLVSVPLTFTYNSSGSNCGCGLSNAVCNSCGVCGGSVDYRDCAGVCFGGAINDTCGVCSAGTTLHIPDADVDCSGVCFGPDHSCSKPNVDPGDDTQTANLALTIVVIGALATCSVALFAMVAYFGYVAVMRRRERNTDWINGAHPVAPQQPRGLSPEAIENLPVVVYGDKQPPQQATDNAGNAPAHSHPERTNDDTCSICLEKYAEGDVLTVFPPCDHRFHTACAEQWLQRGFQCPVCRADLRSPRDIAAATSPNRGRGPQPTGLSPYARRLPTRSIPVRERSPQRSAPMPQVEMVNVRPRPRTASEDDIALTLGNPRLASPPPSTYVSPLRPQRSPSQSNIRL